MGRFNLLERRVNRFVRKRFPSGLRPAWRRRAEPDQVKAARAPLPIRPMWESLRTFGEHARDGARRAIPPVPAAT
jgi:hypothetical protein